MAFVMQALQAAEGLMPSREERLAAAVTILAAVAGDAVYSAASRSIAEAAVVRRFVGPQGDAALPCRRAGAVAGSRCGDATRGAADPDAEDATFALAEGVQLGLIGPPGCVDPRNCAVGSSATRFLRGLRHRWGGGRDVAAAAVGAASPEPRAAAVNRRGEALRLLRMFRSQHCYTVLSSDDDGGASSLLRQLAASAFAVVYVSLSGAVEPDDVAAAIEDAVGVGPGTGIRHGAGAVRGMLLYRVARRLLRAVIGEAAEEAEAEAAEDVDDGTGGIQRRWVKLRAQLQPLAAAAAQAAGLPIGARPVLIVDHCDAADAESCAALTALAAGLRGVLHVVLVTGSPVTFFDSPHTASMLVESVRDPRPAQVAEYLRRACPDLATIPTVGAPGVTDVAERIVVELTGTRIGAAAQAAHFLQELRGAMAAECRGAVACGGCPDRVLDALTGRFISMFFGRSRRLHLYSPLPMGDVELDAARLAVFDLSIALLDQQHRIRSRAATVSFASAAAVEAANAEAARVSGSDGNVASSEGEGPEEGVDLARARAACLSDGQCAAPLGRAMLAPSSRRKQAQFADPPPQEETTPLDSTSSHLVHALNGCVAPPATPMVAINGSARSSGTWSYEAATMCPPNMLRGAGVGPFDPSDGSDVGETNPSSLALPSSAQFNYRGVFRRVPLQSYIQLIAGHRQQLPFVTGFDFVALTVPYKAAAMRWALGDPGSKRRHEATAQLQQLRGTVLSDT